MQANHLNKYLEIPKVFLNHVIDLRIALAQQAKTIEAMAKSKTVRENQNLTDFVISTAQTNQQTTELLDWMKDMLQKISDDANIVFDGARLRNQLQDQSDTIELLMAQKEELIQEKYGRR